MFVERVLRGAKARRVADLGCGDGALLLHLAAAPHPPCATQSSGPSLGQDAGDGSDGGSQTPQVHHPWHQHHHHQQQPTGEAGAAHMAGDATSSDAAHEMPFRELVGVDISGTALARAQKTLQVWPCIAPPSACQTVFVVMAALLQHARSVGTSTGIASSQMVQIKATEVAS